MLIFCVCIFFGEVSIEFFGPIFNHIVFLLLSFKNFNSPSSDILSK